MPELHECPVAACKAVVRNDLLMCRDHWQRVPRAVRCEVSESWSELRSCRDAASVGARRWRYEAARQSAIDAAGGAS